MELKILQELSDLIKNSGFLNEACKRTYDKGEVVLHQGEVCREVFVMERGLIKMHYTTLEGKEWIKSFIVDSGVFGSQHSHLRHEPSTYSVTCIEPTVCYYLAYDGFRKFCDDSLEITRLINRVYEQLALKKEIREYDFLCLSAEDRYVKFIRDNPELNARLTQMDIARYLGITYVALSRIKGRISAT